jgi:hypothetical protein
VVSRDVSVQAVKLRPADYELCIRAAAVAHYSFGMDWLNGVLKSIDQRKKPLDNPWAFFRQGLIDSAKRAGKDFHAAEESVVIPSRLLSPQESVA